MKTYAVIIKLEIDESSEFVHPRKWDFSQLIGSEAVDWVTFDVTDHALERVRIDAESVEVIA